MGLRSLQDVLLVHYHQAPLEVVKQPCGIDRMLDPG